MAAPIATLAIRITGELAELRKTFSDATKEVSGFQTKIGNVARTIATTIGVGFSVGAVTAFVSRITEAAGEIVDLSHKLGISTEAVQKLDFIAGQTGTTVEALGNAVFRLGANVAGGDASTVGAFKRLGLSLEALRALAPEQQFDQVVAAVGRVSSAQERNLALTEIFGRRQAGEIAKIVAEYEHLAEIAPAAGDATIQALDWAGDAADRAKKQFSAMATEGFGKVVIAAEDAQFWVDALADRIGNGIRESATATGAFYRMASSMESVRDRAKEAAKELANLQTKALLNAPSITQPTLGPAGGLDAAGALALSSEVEKALAADTKIANEQLAKQREEWAKNLEAVKKWEEGYQRYQKTFATTEKLLAAVTRESITSRVSQFELHAEVQRGADVWLLQQRVLGTTASLIGGELIPQLSQATLAQAGFGAWTKTVTVDLGALSQSLTNLATVAGGSFGSIARNLATLVSSFDALQKAQQQFATGLEAFKSGSTLAGIAGMASGIMGIVSAAMAAAKAIGAIWNAFDRNKGRDLVKDFAESFGGFDALHEQLLTLGDAGEQLWIKLTQGVGRNNPEQAARVIEEVEAALAKQKAAQDAASVSTEAGAKATIETTAEAVTALAQLNDRIAENIANWKQWSIDVTGSIGTVAAAVRGLGLPTPPVGATAGVTPGFGGVEGGTEQHITVNVDGEVIARASVRGVPRQLTLEGR